MLFKDCIISLTTDYNIVILTKSNCIYCKKSIELCNQYDYDFTTYKIDTFLNNNKQDVLDVIKSYNHGKEYNTLPMIFINKQFIGGYNELKEKIEQDYLFEYKEYTDIDF